MSTETMDRPVAAAPVVALTPPQRAAVVLNTAEYEIKLRELLTNSVGILAVTNKAGRDECHSAYMVLKNARCGITNLAEDATEDAKAFTKAVKTEATRLIAITTAEEERLQKLRDDWDTAEQARKDALIAAERARVEAIQVRITAIRSLPTYAIGKSAAEISQMIYELASTISEDDAHAATFEEFASHYKSARTEVLELLAEAESKQLGVEADARAAEEARKAEAARIAAERAELARLRAEQVERERLAKIEADRIAAEQAAEGKRIADMIAAQNEEARRQREAMEAQLRAEREHAAAEQAKAAAELKAAQDKLAAEKAAHEAKLQLERDHGEAMAMNAQFDAEQEAERARLQALADQAAADARERADDERKTGLPVGSLGPESLTVRDELIDATTTPISDAEIIELVAEVFSLNPADAVERLAMIDFVAARERLAA